MMRRTAISIIVLAAFALATAAAGCGGDDDGKEPTAAETTAGELTANSGTFVGKVKGSDAYIAVVVSGDAVTAYICDGRLKTTRQTVTQWFRGGRSGNAIHLAEGGAQIDARLSGDTVSGTVTLPGQGSLEFTTTRAHGKAGLYRAEGTANGGEYLGGWIVLADGSGRGAVEPPAPAACDDWTSVPVRKLAADGSSQTLSEESLDEQIPALPEVCGPEQGQPYP